MPWRACRCVFLCLLEHCYPRPRFHQFVAAITTLACSPNGKVGVLRPGAAHARHGRVCRMRNPHLRDL